ncbi:MAG: hypothetical protein LBN12_03740 [Clostridiales Family XIII bacterium]|jgi:hypothetical protein|nr:hypothetical protein [Clostridiales Family XIII bacterium]
MLYSDGSDGVVTFLMDAPFLRSAVLYYVFVDPGSAPGMTEAAPGMTEAAPGMTGNRRRKHENDR